MKKLYIRPPVQLLSDDENIVSLDIISVCINEGMDIPNNITWKYACISIKVNSNGMLVYNSYSRNRKSYSD